MIGALTMKKVCHGPTILAALALLGLAVAFYDSYVIYNGQALWCPPPIDGCNEVANSPYARILDVPVGYYGVVYYLGMLGLAGLNALDPASRTWRLAALAGAAVGVGFSVYFMMLQVSFIHAFCVYCLISAATTVLLLCVAAMHARMRCCRLA
jgi:uncharacterized membrane protein